MNHTPKPDSLLTPGEVAAILRVDPKTVTRWAHSGKIPAIRTPGGHRRFYYAAVAAIMQGANPWDAVTALVGPNPTTNPTTPADPNPATPMTAPTHQIPTNARHYLSHPTR